MSLLPYEAFLALRYLRPRRTFVSVITVISVIGVMLGVAVLIIVIAVMSGFDQEWRSKILGFNAHIKVSGEHGILTNYSSAMAQVASNKWVVGVAPFVQGAVLVDVQGENEQSRARPGFLRGVDPELESKVSVLPNSVLPGGSFNVTGNNILVGVSFARGLGLSVGDRIQIYSPGSYAKIKSQLKKKANGGPDIAVLPDEFTIAGIFDVGFEEYNENIIVTSLERAQELYSLNDEAVHGLQVMVTDPYKSNAARASLRETLGLPYDMVTWQEATPVLFNALATEKNMMFFLLFFIMIVAAFGIVNCQITFVVQKTKEIGILKALGANNRQILAIFMSQSVVVGVFGVGCGYLLAVLSLHYRNGFLSFMSHITGRDFLPSAIYQISALPALMEPGDIVLICGTAFITCVAAGLFPAWKASRLQPVEALRHE